MPASVSSTERLELSKLIEGSAPLIGRMDPAKIYMWLINATIACVRQSGETAESTVLRLRSMAGMMADMPAMCFTDETAKTVAKKFKFVPSFSELSEFLESGSSPFIKKIGRAKAILASKDGLDPEKSSKDGLDPEQKRDEAAKARVAALCAAWRSGDKNAYDDARRGFDTAKD